VQSTLHWGSLCATALLRVLVRDTIGQPSAASPQRPVFATADHDEWQALGFKTLAGSAGSASQDLLVKIRIDDQHIVWQFDAARAVLK
jgi:hypothetical protein